MKILQNAQKVAEASSKTLIFYAYCLFIGVDGDKRARKRRVAAFMG